MSTLRSGGIYDAAFFIYAKVFTYFPYISQRVELDENSHVDCPNIGQP